MLTAEERQERNWGMICHLSALVGLIGVPFGNVLGPLVVWLLKRNDSPYVDAQGKESLNFQISMTLYAIACIVLMFVVIGFILFPILMVAWLVFVIIASVRASNGELYHYPMTLRLVK
ncbi:MAG: DUF4870 domain-containing protein [Chloroflexi bacterium]|nr:DUF4870 domain-containing protein [Chloroflexota bacterium]